MVKICKKCGNTFESLIGAKKYCSEECSKTAKKEQDKIKHTRYKSENIARVDLVCEKCNENFKGKIGQKFCSKKCSKNSRLYKHKCIICENEFSDKTYHSKYCSQSCKVKARKNKYKVICKNCNKEFNTNNENQQFCSRPCTDSYSRKSAIRNKCKMCGEVFTGKKDRPNKFCSRDCYYKFIGFDGVAKFNNKRSDTHHIKRAIKYKVAYERIDVDDIYKRDNYICGICGEEVDVNLYYPNPLSPTLDHIIPLSKGGSHTKENVTIAHLKCNVSKNNN